MSDPNSPISPRKGKAVNLRVYLLDHNLYNFQIPVKATGQALWDAVCKHIQLVEADYFDLAFTDEEGLQCWVDRDKPILKQIPSPDTQLLFLVKFYTPDPALLEDEYTRYLFALQIKHDLASGSMTCSENTAALLASYVAQADIGDFSVDDYVDHTYLSNFNYVPNQTEEMEKKIMEFHRAHIGQSPAEADINMLDTARKVELYGIRMHAAKDHEGVPLNLAVAHMGVLVFQTHTKINTFSWAIIRKLSFKRKKFLVKLHPDSYGYYKDTVEFYFPSRNECKGFWKKCLEHHAFFRCLTVKKLPRNKTRVVSRGSSFRYSGKTQKQLMEYVRENYVKRSNFESYADTPRSPSASGRVSCRSTSVTPKIPTKTSTLNSSDLQNSTASSGSHILDTTPDTPLTSTRVETADVHSDSSMSGSRSLGSPKLDTSRRSGAEERVPATPESIEELEIDQDKTTNRGAANTFVSSSIDQDSKTVDVVVVNSFDQVKMSANQNANDNDVSETVDQPIRQFSLPLTNIHSASTPQTVSLSPGKTESETGEGMESIVVVDTGEEEVDQNKLVKSYSKDSASVYYENVDNLQKDICRESKDYDEVLEAEMLSEESFKNTSENSVSKSEVSTTLKIDPAVARSPEIGIKCEVIKPDVSLDKLTDDDVYVNIIATGPIDNDYVSLSADEEKGMGASDMGDTCSSKSGTEGSRDRKEMTNGVGSEAASLDNNEDLIEDITYVLHRRHLEPNNGCKSETALIKGDSLPRRRDKSPSVSRDETKRHSRRSRSPRSRSPSDRSPSAHRKCEIVHPAKLPPKNSYSSVDDSTSPSFEKEMLQHMRKRQADDQLSSQLAQETPHTIVAPIPHLEISPAENSPPNFSQTDANGNSIQKPVWDTEETVKVVENRAESTELSETEKGLFIDTSLPDELECSDDLSPAAALLAEDNDSKPFERPPNDFSTFKPNDESAASGAVNSTLDIPFMDDDEKGDERQVAEAIVQQVFAMVAKQLSTISEESDSSSLNEAPLAQEENGASKQPSLQVANMPKAESSSSIGSDNLLMDPSRKRESIQSDLSSPSRKLSLYDDDSSLAESQGYDDNFDARDMLESLEHINEISELNRDFETSIRLTTSSSFTSETFSDDAPGRLSRTSDRGRPTTPPPPPPLAANQSSGTVPSSSSAEDFAIPVENDIDDGGLESDSSSCSETPGFRRGPRISVDPLEQLERLAVSGVDHFSEESDTERDVTIIRNGHLESSSDSESFPPPPVSSEPVVPDPALPPPPDDLLHPPRSVSGGDLENMEMTDSGEESDTESEGSVDLEKVLEIQGLPSVSSAQNACLSDEDLLSPSPNNVSNLQGSLPGTDNLYIGSPLADNANESYTDHLTQDDSQDTSLTPGRNPRNYADIRPNSENDQSVEGGRLGS